MLTAGANIASMVRVVAATTDAEAGKPSTDITLTAMTIAATADPTVDRTVAKRMADPTADRMVVESMADPTAAEHLMAAERMVVEHLMEAEHPMAVAAIPSIGNQ